MKLENITFRYFGREKNTIEDINLEIKKGEFIILCGSSGCGKTTLTRIINGLCPEFYSGKIQGSYFFGNTDMRCLSLREKSMRIGSVFQDPETQFFATNGFDEIVLGAEQRQIPPGTILEKLEQLNDLFQLSSLFDKNLFNISSGEKQKIAIASVCMLSPEILVLDEPSANLDPDSILKLGDILSDLKKMGMTIILSEHRFHYVSGIFDRAIYLVSGKINKIFSRRQALDLTHEALLRLGLRPFTTPALQLRTVRQSHMENVTERKKYFCVADNISFSYKEKLIFSGLNLAIPFGKITAIIGKNGVGKTTLLRVLSGLYQPKEGSISFEGKAISRKKRIASSFLLEQNGNNQLFSNEVRSEFLIDVPKQNAEIIDHVLYELDLYSWKTTHPLSLSGGQKQRLLVGISALSQKKLLLLDEPTSGLDAMNMGRISKLLRHNATQGQTIVMVTHDIEFINATADYVIEI